eukprot:scaffold89619_cov93-Phaeocystis_antarctica.AAC.1
MSSSASRARISYQQCPKNKLLRQEQGASLALSGLWVTQAEVRRARGGGGVHVLMLGMKSAAPRGAIAESKLQDHLRPDHDTGSNASAAPKRSSSSVTMECSIKIDARTPPWQQRRCRHGGRSYL